MRRTSDPPAVSIVVPFFDAGRFLADAIDSVLAQSFDRWELLLVDDGSRDDGPTIATAAVNRHPDRLHLLRHPGGGNRGVCASRNLGVRAARADLVALLDADDVWLPDKLARQVERLARFPRAEMIFGRSRYWWSWDAKAISPPPDHDAELGIAGERIYGPGELTLALYPLTDRPAPCPSSLVMRRDLVARVGGFEESFRGDLQLYEDQAFLSKVYLQASTFVADEVFDLHRVHVDSCEARVLAKGRYREIREYFFDWFQAYLARRSKLPPGLWRAVREARSAGGS
jgi:glycosyltransferase involved in cell wall biosynthesis